MGYPTKKNAADLLARQAREKGAPLRAPRGRRRGKYSKKYLALLAAKKEEANDGIA
jgi:hypothetical protein